MQTVNYSEALAYWDSVFNSLEGKGGIRDIATGYNVSIPQLRAFLAQSGYPTTAGGFAALVSNRGE